MDNDKLYNTFLGKPIRNSNSKETDIHFQVERLQNRNKYGDTFDAKVELKSLTENCSSFIGKDRNKKSTNFGRKEINVRVPKRKLPKPKFILVR